MDTLNSSNRGSTLYVVIPCYNEEESLPETVKRLREKMNELISDGTISDSSRVMLIDDGSADRTWEMINALHNADRLFCGVKLSRNRGHQNALLAGLMTARFRCDFTISMVYGVRSSRENDSFFKRATAEGYYKLLSTLGGEIVYNHADYRMMSKTALEALSNYGEVNLFLRGIVPMLGYKTDIVEYERGERIAGESKYPLKKMLDLAEEGVTSLSVKPLRAIFRAGAAALLACLVLLIVFIVQSAVGIAFTGWKTLLLVMLLLGRLILISIGIVGEYAGKIYLETKHRPPYFIECIVE